MGRISRDISINILRHSIGPLTRHRMTEFAHRTRQKASIIMMNVLSSYQAMSNGPLEVMH
jgi:hypothetical protein